MQTNRTLNLNKYKWSFYCSPNLYWRIHNGIICFRKVVEGKYYYGLHPDDCTHSKNFVFNAIKHYLYVKEMIQHEI